MRASEHFECEEFLENQWEMPAEGVFQKIWQLCNSILEPIRCHFKVPMLIMSGCRSPLHNTLVGGSSSSYHLFTEDHAAADFVVPGVSLTTVFDWIRLESHIPFDKVILERAKGRDDDLGACIHVQTRTQPRRQALIGSTHGQGAYQSVEVV